MKRRTFLQALSLGVVSTLTGAHRLLGDDSAMYGVPQPPGPPGPLKATPLPQAEPPYAREVPSIPFDAPPGSWTLVSMPDTQSMSGMLPAEYNRQSDWIVAHRESHNIRFVVHEGDLVNVSNSTGQWDNAQAAMRILTNAGVPYSLMPGNHDLGFVGLASDRNTLLNNYFSVEDYRHSEAMSLFEEGKMENSWHYFSAPSANYLVLSLEYWPRDAVVDWAEQIIKKNRDRKVILVTHAYLSHISQRFAFTPKGVGRQWFNPRFEGIARYGGVNDGEDLWQKLVTKNSNVFLVLCGHDICNGTGYLMSRNDHGHPVHQILANYQYEVEPHRPYFGGGYLRLMQFYPDRTVQVKTYSPWLDHWLTEPDQQFSFTV